MLRLAASLILSAALLWGTSAGAAPQPSVSRGLPWDGSLVGGVLLPAGGPAHFTWDPIRKRTPNRAWRRWGSDRLVTTVLRTLTGYARAYPWAPPVGLGDLSRRHGGDFGARFGYPGHASHQNGLDVDVYYPRRDRRLRPPDRPRQIDRRLAQALVDRFVSAGAEKVFIGPNTGLRGPRSVVSILPAWHDNHMHVRLPPRQARRQAPGAPRTSARRRVQFGRTAAGRRLHAWHIGDPRARRRVLVVGCIHGDECAGTAVTRALVRHVGPLAGELVVVQNLNPDGRARRWRWNGRGTDLNRNFPAGWRRHARSGARPFSEPEARAARALVARVRPAVTVWFHQPQGLVRASGASVGAARRYARATRMPFRALPWIAGSAPQWQNRRLRQLSFVVELPPGKLPAAAARRHARALLALVR